MKVWVVYADDNDYDSGVTWCVGVYSTKDRAEEARDANRRKYVGWIPPSQVCYKIEHFEIDVE